MCFRNSLSWLTNFCDFVGSIQPGSVKDEEDEEETPTEDAWKEAFSSAVRRVRYTRQAVVRHDAELWKSEAQMETNTTTVGNIQQQLYFVTGCTKVSA